MGPDYNSSIRGELMFNAGGVLSKLMAVVTVAENPPVSAFRYQLISASV